MGIYRQNKEKRKGSTEVFDFHAQMPSYFTETEPSFDEEANFSRNYPHEDNNRYEIRL